MSFTVSVPNCQDAYGLTMVQAGALFGLLNHTHRGTNIVLIPHEVPEFISKCCLTNSKGQDPHPVSPQQQLTSPEGGLLTLRFRACCWSPVKYSQTICFATQISSKWKVPFFFFLLFTLFWKKIVSSGSILFPELLVPKQSIPIRLKWPMWTFLEWNVFIFHLEMIFSHMQFIVTIFTQKHIDKLSKGKLGPKYFDFITAESFDWPEVTFYRTSISHRISLAHTCFCFVGESGKIFPHVARSGLPWSYESFPELVPPPWFSSSGQKQARLWHCRPQQPSLGFTPSRNH